MIFIIEKDTFQPKVTVKVYNIIYCPSTIQIDLIELNSVDFAKKNRKENIGY